MVDFRPPCHFGKATIGAIIYVDNCVFVGTESETVRQARKLAAEALERYHLPIHDIEDEQSEMESLGLHFGQDAIGSTAKRRWKLRRALEAVLPRPFLSGSQLEVLIGQLTFCFLINRPLLSMFNSVYVYMRRCYHKKNRL
jgi:hypothetical protein